jgi:hypothetical protein
MHTSASTRFVRAVMRVCCGAVLRQASRADPGRIPIAWLLTLIAGGRTAAGVFAFDTLDGSSAAQSRLQSRMHGARLLARSAAARSERAGL